MKLYITLALLLGATLAALVSALALQHHHANEPAVAHEQTFEVKGIVRSLEDDGRTVHIAHEEIPGFMPAMEMPFTVKEPHLLKGVAAGDSVKIRLVVTKDDSWLTRLEKLPPGKASGVQASAQPGTAPSPASETRALQAGQSVPDFNLIDQDGRPFSLNTFRGKAVLLTFIYTRCPLPNFCPLMSKNFASLQARFARECPGQVQLVSVSFDARFDTPQVLKQYAAAFQTETNDWIFATGTPEQVDFVTGLFGLYREPANGFINHDLRTALIAPDGKLVHVWRSNVWTPYEVQRRVRETLQPITRQANPISFLIGRASPTGRSSPPGKG